MPPHGDEAAAPCGWFVFGNNFFETTSICARRRVEDNAPYQFCDPIAKPDARRVRTRALPGGRPSPVAAWRVEDNAPCQIFTNQPTNKKGINA